MYNRLLAYAVHLFTILGVYVSFLAIEAAVEKNISLVFLYLAIALLIDGIDGSLARWADVKTFAPKINGEILDNIIDYLNYVVVPVFIFYTLNMVPEPFLLLSSAAILLVSCFTFINTETKTEDFYFSGFPANWNIVILYFYILDSTQWINLFFVLLFCVLTFIPFKYVHPFRVVEFRKITLLITSIWMVTTTVLLFGITFTNPLIGTLNYVIWLLTNAYFLGNVFYRSTK